MNPNRSKNKLTGSTKRVDLGKLEEELHAAQPRNRQQQRAVARVEAESISRVRGQHYRSRPVGGAS